MNVWLRYLIFPPKFKIVDKFQNVSCDGKIPKTFNLNIFGIILDLCHSFYMKFRYEETTGSLENFIFMYKY